MKMVGYYAWHTFLNSLKKIFRSTFVVIFVAVIAIGVIFGFSAGLVADIVDSKNENQTEYSSEEYSGTEEEQDTDESAEDDNQFTFEDTQFMQLCFELEFQLYLSPFAVGNIRRKQKRLGYLPYGRCEFPFYSSVKATVGSDVSVDISDGYDDTWLFLSDFSDSES